MTDLASRLNELMDKQGKKYCGFTKSCWRNL